MLPAVYSRYAGNLDTSGQGMALIKTPNMAGLVGVRIHSAFLTIKPGAPPNFKSISTTFHFDVTK